MTTANEFSADRIENYKKSVKKMWKIQLASLVAAILSAAVLLTTGVITQFINIYLISILGFIIAGFLFCGCYGLQYAFYKQAKKWGEYAPVEDKPYIDKFAKSLIALFTISIISFLFTLFSTVLLFALGNYGAINWDASTYKTFFEVTTICTLIIQIILSITAIVAIILQLFALFKLNRSKTLPYQAKRGTKSLLLYNAILSGALVVNLGLTMGIKILLFCTDLLTEYMYVYTIASIIGQVILIAGAIVSLVFFYRGWWLISKSSLTEEQSTPVKA